MHSWGDDWEHWDDLYEAQIYVFNYVYKYSWVYVDMKEKWGTTRYQRLIAPGGFRFGPHLYIPYWPRRITIGTKTIECKRFIWIWNQSWIYNKWLGFGNYMLGRAVRNAIKRWPNAKKEIIGDLHNFD